MPLTVNRQAKESECKPHQTSFGAESSFKGRHVSRSSLRHRNRGRFIDHPEDYIEDVDPRKVFAYQQGRCYRCGHLLIDKYECDHVWPIWLGGRHEFDNIGLLHPQCHRDKTNEEIWVRQEWQQMLRMSRAEGIIGAQLFFARSLDASELMPTVESVQA